MTKNNPQTYIMKETTKFLDKFHTFAQYNKRLITSKVSNCEANKIFLKNRNKTEQRLFYRGRQAVQIA